MKFQFIAEQCHLFPVRRLCIVLNVSENGYYNWRKRGICSRKQEDERLIEHIEDAYEQGRQKYGSPRIHAELKAKGIFCARKRVARLMREQQIRAQRKRRSARKTENDPSSPIAPNLLMRDFSASAPNQKWMTDMTFVATHEGWLYLAGVIDAYSRRLVGWAMGKRHDATLVEDALKMALARRQPAAGLIHHSDRGSEYTSQSYRDLLQEHQMQGSMSRKGDCYDNAVVESFWGTMKEEGIEEKTFLTHKEAKEVLFEYIEIFYNRKRRHSFLGYVSPTAYEEMWKIQQKKEARDLDKSL